MTRFRRAALAAVLAVATAAGLAASAAATTHPRLHPGATTVCGNDCVSNWGEFWGPQFIMNATNSGAVAPGALQGRKINLRQRSNSATNEDFGVTEVGLLKQFCTASGGNGQIPAGSYACLTVLPAAPNSPVFEFEWTPNGVETNFCAGAVAAVADYKLRLEHCGVPRVWWIRDDLDVTENPGERLSLVGVFAPFIFAKDSRATHPLAMTALEFPGKGDVAKPLHIRRLNFTGPEHAIAAQDWHRPLEVGPAA